MEFEQAKQDQINEFEDDLKILHEEKEYLQQELHSESAKRADLEGR